MLKLITEIMILLTALIGFYKVVRYSKPVAYTSALRATKDSPTTKRLLSYFEPALAFLGVYAAILVPMVFMIGFIWLMGGTTSLLGRLSHPKADMTINLPQLGSENGPNYWAWQTARVVSSPGDREKLLTAVVQAAIQNSQYAVALGAARDMPYPGVRDGNLVQVATSAAASGDAAVAASAVEAISAPGRQGDTAKSVVQLLLQRARNTSTAPPPAPPRASQTTGAKK